MDSREMSFWEGSYASCEPARPERCRALLPRHSSSAFRPRRPLLLPLRVGPLQQVLGAGTAQMRAAVLHHHLAIDVAGGIGNEKTRQIGKLAMLAVAPERISRCPSFLAPLGAKLTRCARGRKRAGRNRHGADALGSP